MTANVVSFRKPALEIGCTGCGATVDAACDCGVPYMPAGQRAAAAIAANPRMSDRAIATELGIGSNTVRRARQQSTAPHGAVEDEPRVGIDGKVRRLPTRAAPEVTEDSPSELRKAFLFYAYEAKLLARYDGPVDDEVIESALQTAAAWQQLATIMQGNAND